MTKSTRLAIVTAVVLAVVAAGVFWVVPSKTRTRGVENHAADAEGVGG